jgi:bacillopeptidase F
VDPSVYPGATEIAFDGIDQNCNGYDMTIDVIKIRAKKGVLKVKAASQLGTTANLQVESHGPMTYDHKKDLWTYEGPLNIAPASPGYKVYLHGTEGTLEAPLD